MEKLMDWLASPATWRGLIYITMAMGIRLDPDQENAIIAGGLALAGLIHAFTSHRT